MGELGPGGKDRDVEGLASEFVEADFVITSGRVALTGEGSARLDQRWVEVVHCAGMGRRCNQ